jgi:hypothetical protein
MKDPFSPEADPDPRAPLLPDVSRRALLVVAPAAALLAGCATPRLACAPKPEDARSCQHRFCRYYRGPAPERG